MAIGLGKDFNIVQAVQEFSHAGGVETVAYELQRCWTADGTTASVLAATIGDDVGPEERRAVRLALPPMTRLLPTRGRWRYLGRSAIVPAYTLAASVALKRGRRPAGWAENAVVLSHGDSFIADVVVLHSVNAASLAQKRADHRWHWALNPMHAWVGARDRIMLQGLRASRYVAVSRRVVDELERFHAVPRDRIAVIGNGTDIDRFTPEGTRASLRDRFGIPADAPLLLFVGHEFDRKGLAHVVGALTGPGCRSAHLVAVGAGDAAAYRTLAETLGVGARVHFAGPRRDLPEIYREADAFVLPSAYETFSLVCMEAMASGVPVFATRVGGIEDYLQEGVNGFFIEREAGSVAAALAPALADPALLARLAQGARRTAQAYAWPHVANQYRALLHETWREKMACKFS